MGSELDAVLVCRVSLNNYRKSRGVMPRLPLQPKVRKHVLPYP